VHVIATSWSDNPNKGSNVVAWLDANLDHERYEVTFAGQLNEALRHVRALGAIPTQAVAEELRRNDVYLAPSRNDPCSNALLEALASGLPAAFRASGGHPELVGDGGLPFDSPEDVPAVLDRLVAELDERRAAIRVASLAEVADRYLEVLGIVASA
jgi:glycosyltransferase involved in cell wall biosynthesis